jgi:hypothetical protein
MRNVTGAVAEGTDFFNRTHAMEAYWRDLETDNILLLAPRRVGKTSLMRKMAANADAHGFRTIFADLSDCAGQPPRAAKTAVAAEIPGDVVPVEGVEPAGQAVSGAGL